LVGAGVVGADVVGAAGSPSCAGVASVSPAVMAEAKREPSQFVGVFWIFVLTGALSALFAPADRSSRIR
jgi:hypothetical protein